MIFLDSKNNKECGAYIVICSLGFVILFMFVGLAVDVGRAYVQQATLARVVDSAALAAASRMASGQTAADAAACNAAKMNSLPCNDLVTSFVDINDAKGNQVRGVQVTSTSSTPTIFMRAAKLLGCGSVCDQLNISASATAAPGGLVDLVLDLDDTGSMNTDGWLGPAKTGAITLLDAMVPESASSSSATKLALVPFNGCYNGADVNCEDPLDYPSGDLVSLSTNNTTIKDGINALSANGLSGTNLCLGLEKSRAKLFESGRARSNAKKYIIILTDAVNNYVYQLDTAESLRCRPTSGDNDTKSKKLNRLTYFLSQDVKNGTSIGTSGQTAGQTVEVFVIMYGYSGTIPSTCTPPTGGLDGSVWDTTPIHLARCMATSAGHLYLAPTPADLQSVFKQIASRLPVRLLK